MGILEHFSAGWGKGFSREAGRVLEGAVELAGNYGCDKADTGHLLLAILQQDSWPKGGGARPGGCAGRTWPPSCAGRWTTP